jgi:hypothetical protein
MVFIYWKIGEKNVVVSALSPIDTFRGIDDRQMDGETEGQVSRRVIEGHTNQQTDKNYLLPTKPKGSTCISHRPKNRGDNILVD